VLHYCNNEDEDMYFLFLEMLQVALGPQWWRSERLLSSGDSLPRKPSACLRAAKTTFRVLRPPYALCTVICSQSRRQRESQQHSKFNTEYRLCRDSSIRGRVAQEEGAGGERDLTQVSSVPSRVGPARHCSRFRHAPRNRSG
jgi:hypothetical protein